MKKVFFIIVAIIFIFTKAFSQEGNRLVKVTSVKITDKIYKLICSQEFEVNVTAFIGNDGILLVDDGLGAMAEAIKAELKKISDKEVKYVINTHLHGDHTGGNAFFGKEAKLIASKGVVKNMSIMAFIQSDDPEAVIPKTAIDKETDLKFNGEVIKMIPLPGGHSGGDMIVYFKKSGIVAAGDLLFSDRFPYLDPANGGNPDGFIKSIEYLSKKFPPKTIFIAGHGRDYSVKDVKQYLDMLNKTKSIVKREMAITKDLKELTKKDILKGWEEWSTGFINKDAWIGILYNGIESAKKPKLPSILEALINSIKTESIESTIKFYKDQKIKPKPAYSFNEAALNLTGYYLLKLKRVFDAIEVLKINVEEYPVSANVYDSLGEAYMVSGDKDIAIKNYQKSLELNPNNDNARANINKMNGK